MAAVFVSLNLDGGERQLTVRSALFPITTSDKVLSTAVASELYREVTTRINHVTGKGASPKEYQMCRSAMITRAIGEFIQNSHTPT